MSQLDEQVHERAVPLLAEAEQGFVDGTPVVPCPVVDRAVLAERVTEPVAAQRGAGRVDQFQAGPDPLLGDEVPVPCDALAGHGFQPTADSAEPLHFHRPRH